MIGLKRGEGETWSAEHHTWVQNNMHGEIPGSGGCAREIAVDIVLNFKDMENAPGSTVTINTTVKSAGRLHMGVRIVQRNVIKKIKLR